MLSAMFVSRFPRSCFYKLWRAAAPSMPDMKSYSSSIEATPHTISEIASLVKSGSLDVLQERYPRLSPLTVSVVLVRAQSEPERALNFFRLLTDSDKGGGVPTVESTCIMACILTSANMRSECLSVFEDMLRRRPRTLKCKDVFRPLVMASQSCNHHPVVFHLLIKAYLHLGMTDYAAQILRLIWGSHQVPHVMSFCAVLSALVKSRQTALCWEIYHKMKSLKVSSSAFTFSIMIRAACIDGKMKIAHSLLTAMEEQGFNGDITVYNTLIDGYCKKGNWKKGFKLYQLLKKRYVTPDVVTFTILIGELCKHDEFDRVHVLYNRMVHLGLKPNLVTFQLLIVGACKLGFIDKAKEFLGHMFYMDLLPDHITCRSVIESYCKIGEPKEALDLLRELSKRGVAPTVVNYSMIIEELCLQGILDIASDVLKEMMGKGLKPTEFIYSRMIEGYCCQNSLQEAFLLKDKMKEEDVQLDVNVLLDIINQCLKTERFSDAAKLAQEMVASGFDIDLEILERIVYGYCDTDMIEELIEFLEFVIEAGMDLKEDVFNPLIDKLCNQGNKKVALTLEVIMSKLNKRSNNKNLKVSIRAC